MVKLFRNIATILTLILLNSFGLFAHASAMPMTGHDMGTMEHQSSGAANCATLCRTAVLNKDESVARVNKEEDDTEPALPFYAQGLQVQTPAVDIDAKLYADKVLPPPKVPLHILFGVSRN